MRDKKNLWLAQFRVEMMKKIGAVGKIGIAVFILWFVLKFVFDKSGFVHILLLFAISSAVLQIVHNVRAWQK